MKRTCIFLFSGMMLLFFSCTDQKKEGTETDFTQFVDPYIGSDYHGHVFVGANVPFGMVQLGPNNETQGWDWCSGYHYSDSVLIGFAHTHLSGTGIGDLGDIVFMPVSGAYDPDVDPDSAFNWKSTYSHDRETVAPGYYSVHIDRYGIDAELTAAERVGFHKYTYRPGDPCALIIDLNYGTGWDQLTAGVLEEVDDQTIRGQRFSKGWAKDQQIFFLTKFSKKIRDFLILESNEKQGKITALLTFEGGDEVIAKTALSPVSMAGAEANLAAGPAGWNFDAVKEKARAKWNKELGKIRIKTRNPADKRTFYTALYHTMIAPSLFNDANGDYRGADRKVHENPGHDTYTVFSLWDTYRAAHPLFTLVQPERVNDFINSMLAIFDEQGKLPIWHLHGNETNTMVGYSAVPVIADAYLKGFRGFDAERAFEAMKTSALLDERGLDFIKSKGYIPADTQHESVARALEYAIDDWGIAAMAKAMGKTEDARRFSKRARYYKKYFDKTTGFMRGKMSDESWRSPFNPVTSQHRADDYCEGNAWQYTWLVPQDVEGLIGLFESEEAFVTKLDSLFAIPPVKVEGASADITGLIGQYAHGNEPSHHTTYLYAYAGQQWKTAEKVHEICTTMYTDQPDGLCGNEDCGQMSAWYVFSALGFYPVNPSNGAYVFGTPAFDEAEIALPEGKSFKIVAENNGKANNYIQSATLNGKPYKKSFITHKTLLKGGELILQMGSEPNKNFGKDPENRPRSVVY